MSVFLTRNFFSNARGLTLLDGGGVAWSINKSTNEVSAAAAATVSSVGLADGSSTPVYTISGSPVTGTGTLTLTLKTQTANTIFAGPNTGAAAQPTFRALVLADIPTGYPYGSLSGAPSIPVGANPSASVGLSAINGSAATFMRSDGAPALNVGIIPTWTGTHTWSGNTLAHAIAGKLVVGTPSAGIAIQALGVASTAAVEGVGTGVFVQSRDNNAAGAITRLTATNTVNILDFTWGTSAVPGSIRHGGTEVIGISTTRSVTIPAPSSGDTLALTNVAGANALTVNGNAAGTAVVRLNTQATTGAQTATFTATNKPGSGTTAPTKWIPLNIDGTTMYVPAWL